MQRTSWWAPRGPGVGPVYTSRDLMGRTTAGFFVVTGLAGVVFGLSIPSPCSNRLVFLGGAAFAIATGLGVYVMRSRLSSKMHVGFIAVAIGSVTMLIGQSPSVAGDVAVAALYTCIACHAALAFPWRTATVLTVVVVVSCLVAGVVDSDMPWWSTIPVATAAGLIGASVIALNLVANQAILDPLTGGCQMVCVRELRMTLELRM